MYTAEPPIILPDLPNGVSISSNAIEPTTVSDMLIFLLSLAVIKLGKGNNN
jgi:hypothetical protein